MNYYLSLGSNIGDRMENLTSACFRLETAQIKIVNVSSVYESQPVDVSAQPWFLNIVLEVSAHFEPLVLLKKINAIESEMGRHRSMPKGPRIIDIDIILADQLVFQTRHLEIPHPRMHRRKFVLVPISEIAPEVVHPVFNQTLRKLNQKCEDQSAVKKLNDVTIRLKGVNSVER